MKTTITLIILNVFAFIYSAVFPENFDNFLHIYGFSPGNFIAGNYYTILTSLFLHANLGHLANNMLALFFLGIAVEKNTKKWQYLLTYFFSGFVGNLSMFIPFFGYGPETIGIGASAAISGLVGLGIFMFPGKLVIFPTVVPVPFILAGAIYLLVNLSNLFVPSEIAYSAHLFGISAGSLLGMIWGKNVRKRLFVLVLLILLITSLPLVVGYFFT